MSEWTTLKRSEVEPQPGEYYQCKPDQVKSSGHLLVMRCPACKSRTFITGEVHEVTALGYIIPRVRCPHTDCTFVDGLYLDDWHPPTRGSA